MFWKVLFVENVYVLGVGNPAGKGLSRIAADHGMLMMMCAQCALHRHPADGAPDWCKACNMVPEIVLHGVRVECIPQLYTALTPAMLNHIITL